MNAEAFCETHLCPTSRLSRLSYGTTELHRLVNRRRLGERHQEHVRELRVPQEARNTAISSVHG
jgi:hypothetical protein